MKWELKTFDELTNLQLYRILQLRNAVFVVEQNCVYQDLDGDDLKCHHLFLQDPADNIIAAYCRIVPPGIHYTESSIGRVLTNPEKRKQGMGKALMTEAINICKELYPASGIKIGAQYYLLQFYTELGFQPTGDLYLEDGIEHIKMNYTT